METLIGTLGEYAAHLWESVTESYPAMAAEPALCAQAMALLARIDGEQGSDGADDNYAAMLGAAERSVRSATANTEPIGARSTERAEHLWPIGSALPSEPVAVALRAIDGWTEQSKSTIRQTRSSSGRTSRVVLRYGRSFADGSTDARDTERPLPYPLDGMLESVRRTDGLGADGIELARIASAAFGVPMVGAEFKSWSEVLPADVSARLGAEPYNYAAHTTGPYRATGERTLPAYRTRHAITYRTRESDPIAGPVTVWAPLWRQYLSAGDTVARRTPIDGWEIRDSDGRLLERSRARMAVRSAPPETLSLGHRTIRRSPSKGSRAVRASALSEAFVIPAGSDVLAEIARIAATVEPSRAVRWATADRAIVGTITRGESGRYAATVTGSDHRARGCRTITAMARQLAPAFY